MGKKCIKELIKEIKNLEDLKASVLNFENGNCMSTYQDEKDKIKVDYSFAGTRAEIQEINNQIRKYKHHINYANVTVIVPEIGMTIDGCLIDMAQLNNEIMILDARSKYQAKTRRSVYSGAVEFTELNYNLDECKLRLKEYKERVQALQIAIDRINLSFLIEV